jgi:hypothetical protein
MVLLLEEIAVEAVAVIATLVAAACLLIVLAGFALEHRALRALKASRLDSRCTRSAQSAERPTVPSAFSPSPN